MQVQLVRRAWFGEYAENCNLEGCDTIELLVAHLPLMFSHEIDDAKKLLGQAHQFRRSLFALWCEPGQIAVLLGRGPEVQDSDIDNAADMSEEVYSAWEEASQPGVADFSTGSNVFSVFSHSEVGNFTDGCIFMCWKQTA